jgi:hypothetical protein
MNYQYSYTLSQFLNQKADLDSLTTQIRSSTIVSALDYINETDPNVDIFFKSELISADVSTLNTVVANHTGQPTNSALNSQLISYGTPYPFALPSIAKAYTPSQIQVLGNNGPNLSNLTDFNVTWTQETSTLASLNLSTTDGIPAWYLNLIPLSSNTFSVPYPALSLSGTGISKLDGQYWANVISPGTFVLASKGGEFTLLFRDTSTSYIAPQYNANFLIFDPSGTIIQSDIRANVYGDNFYSIESLAESTTTSTTFQSKTLLTVKNLPTGLYRIGINYTWSGSSTTYNFESRLMVNGAALGSTHIARITNVVNYIPGYRSFYKVLAGNNTIDLQYRTSNAGGTARIRDAIIELWRVS